MFSKILISTLFTFSCFALLAQKTPSENVRDTLEREGLIWQFKTDPTSLFNFLMPGLGLNIGSEVILRERCGIYGEIGKSFTNNYWRYKAELKYYFKLGNGKYKYIGLAFMHKNQTFKTRGDSIEADVNYFKKYSITRHIHSYSLIFGIDVSPPRSEYIEEIFFGGGIRYKHAYTNDLTAEEIDMRMIGSPEGGFSRDCSGNTILPNIVFGVRIGGRVPLKSRK
jgi:hypothetical protein